MDDGSKGKPTITVGVDLGDRCSYLCFLDTESGEVIEKGRVHTTPEALRRRFFSEQQPLRTSLRHYGRPSGRYWRRSARSQSASVNMIVS